MNKTPQWEIDREREKNENEVSVFWDLISSHLPKSVERSALGDEKIFLAFKAAYPSIKNYIVKSTLEEVINEIPDAEIDEYSGDSVSLLELKQQLRDKWLT